MTRVDLQHAPAACMAIAAVLSFTGLTAAAPPASTEAREEVENQKTQNPPAIQMFVPGFRVHELPIELTNVNNVRYREDGTLVTLGYNGDIHLLSDTNGDGLEDQAHLFWKNEGSLRGPIGMQLTPPDYPHGWGIFTPSKGKLSLIVDRDGDDRADEEIIVAEGWQEIPQNVDATGVTIGPDGSLYFGLGTANYADAYQINKAGNSEYRLESERGTVQRVSPDFKTRETIATGIRFPIAFAFNAAGDLFCTEQEGATWLPNGNPFDELLHIQAGRHYGFPPRHPRHNPDVIDEPSTFDYAPQHQSTCGMVFNEPLSAGGAIFGPGWWAGDALVCGESRGKLWRTTLVPSPTGYVADNQLIAGLQMLTVDCCVAPDGDLLVACHSGPPDWGTGPAGIGKLFRIEMIDAAIPRPTRAWANGEREVCISYDRPLDPLKLTELLSDVRIEYGHYVRAGDRFETLVPPYAVVKAQSEVPRFRLPVYSVSVASDLRTLLVQTAPMRANVHYAVTLPSFVSTQPEDNGVELHSADALQQHPQTDVDFALHGVIARWEPDDGQNSWSGWLPHLDWRVSQRLTEQSSMHGALREASGQAGTLSLQTRLNLKDILRPAVQPGAKLDYEWPEEQTTLVVRASQPFVVQVDDVSQEALRSEGEQFQARITVSGEEAESLLLSVRLPSPAGAECDLTVAVFTNEDERLRPLPLNRFVLPWVVDSEEPESTERTAIPELAGGNWGKGRRVFHSEAASCFKCHAVDPGVGATIGPNLSNLVHRDYASVLRDITAPSFAINPDYISHTILTHAGQVLTGVLQTRDGKLVLGDSNGTLTELRQEEIESMKPSPVSIMPTGVEEKLTSEQMRDLLTYLLTPPPQMPLESPLEAPPVRTQAEVAAVLAGAAPTDDPPNPLRLVLVAGKKDHGPGEHDYPAWQAQWVQLLAAAENVSIDTAWEFPSEAQLSEADVLIFFQKGAWNDERQRHMDRYFERGGGAVYIHWAVNGDDRVADFSRRIGLASEGGKIGYRHGPLTLQVHNTDHPIMRNIDEFHMYDESYWLLTGDPQQVRLLASSVEDGAARPQLWTYEPGNGRVFVSIPGHYSWTFDDPIFRTILLRGIAWSAREPVDRFNELVPIGARVSR